MLYYRVLPESEKLQFLVLMSSLVFILLILTVFILFAFFQKQKAKFIIDKMQDNLHFQTELVKSKIEIKDQTLSQIGRELHDNIGQILSVALMQMNIILDKRTVEMQEIENLKEIVTESLNEIRVLSRLSNKESCQDFCLITSIKSDLSRIQNLKKIKCTFELNTKMPTLNEEHELFLYRILQEGITNILKHSQSDVIILKIEVGINAIMIFLKDEGIGIEYSNKSGTGLNNMKYRTNLIGAEMDIKSSASGTEITIIYPLDKPYEI